MNEVYLSRSPFRMTVDVHVVQSNPQGGRRYIGRPNEHGSLDFMEEIVDGYEVAPTFILPEDVVKAIVEKGGLEGFKTETESTIAGKLEAQSVHLSDMRAIVGSRLKIDSIGNEVGE